MRTSRSVTQPGPTGIKGRGTTSEPFFRRFDGGYLAAVVLASMGLPGCGHAPGTIASASLTAEGALAQADVRPTLQSIVAPPDRAVVQMYVDAGATDAKAHALSEQEWALVEAALAQLPTLHRSVLERHLVRLSFIDAPESAGTGLTRQIDSDARLFDITLRAEVLGTSLSDFLTGKEAALFNDDESGLSVHIDAGSAPALPYILLHEATHVVDGALGLSARQDSPFRSGLWIGYRELAPPYDASLVARTPFRRHPKIAISEAPALYAALEGTPFVSLYASASAGEDLAELVAWRQLATRSETGLRIDVKNAAGRLVYRGEPLKSPGVRRRFRDVDALLSSPWGRETGDTR